jgi:hypothetical protein
MAARERFTPLMARLRAGADAEARDVFCRLRERIRTSPERL